MLRSPSTKVALGTLAAILFVVALAAAIWEYSQQRSLMRMHSAAITDGDPERGEAMFIQYGCGSCHAASGVRTATGAVGPPLDGIGTRVIIAGHLANTPANMEQWIRDPQHVSPGTAMPDLHVGEEDARDITAFLYARAK
jgi:cytochrome c2